MPSPYPRKPRPAGLAARATQVRKQAEAEEVRELMASIDRKLDELHRQSDELLRVLAARRGA